jgi:L-ascorbate metabolism protein UlaG (beta-lactamase superfamily)
MEIEWVNHASFVVSSRRIRLLTDPWIFGRAFNESWDLLVPSKFSIDDFSRITHIWFSHEHPDHFSPSVLSRIPETTRKKIRVLFQQTRDQRVVSFCKKQGFGVTELLDGESLDIAPDFRVTCQNVPFYDSWLAIEAEGKCLLNMNDCVVTNPAVMRRIKRRFRHVDVLFQQFSYAGWVTNEDQHEAWKACAREFAEVILSHTAEIQPQYIVPFASFVRFCHAENKHMNRHVNRIGDITRLLEQQRIAEPIVLFPGDKWSPGEPHTNAQALARYADAQAAPFTPNVSKSIPLADIMQLAGTYHERMLAKHNRAFVIIASALGLMPRITFRLSDLKQNVSFDWKNGPQYVSEAVEPDITLHSDSLAYLFRFDWGLDTLFVSGRFHSDNGGIRKLLRTLALGSLANIGKRFGPELIFDVDLLKRAASTLVRWH